MKPGTPYRFIEHPFDSVHGVDTSGYIGPRELSTAHASDALNNGYSAIAPSVFREAMRRWRVTLTASRGRIETYRFVDLGAGKGRAMLLASELPFRTVIGVEIHPRLAEIAASNSAKWSRDGHARAAIRVVCRDAASFRWPRSPLLVYLYNPFERELVGRLLARLRTAAAGGSKPLDVLYVNPVHSDLFGRGSGFRHRWSVRLTMDQADQEADPYATTTDMVSAFRWIG